MSLVHALSRSHTRPADAEALTSLLAYGAMIGKTGNAELGRELVRALRAMGGSAVPALSDALRRPRSGRIARMAAAWLLGRVGGKRAHQALCRALGDPDGDVATAARRSLDSLGRPPCRKALAAA